MATVAKPAQRGPRVIPEIEPEMVRATLRNPENVDFQAQIGGCLAEAQAELRWTLEQLAAELKRDARQVRRWIAGEERCQVDVVFSVPALREPFVIALAKLAQLAVEETVTIRRRA